MTTACCMVEPFTGTHFPRRACQFSAPSVWNSLLHGPTVLISDFLLVFKSRLKTLLFTRSSAIPPASLKLQPWTTWRYILDYSLYLAAWRLFIWNYVYTDAQTYEVKTNSYTPSVHPSRYWSQLPSVINSIQPLKRCTIVIMTSLRLQLHTHVVCDRLPVTSSELR